MKNLDEIAKKLGYTDVYHLEQNLELNPEFIEWWEVIKELKINFIDSSLQLPSLKELNTEMKQLSEKLDTDSKQTEKIYFEAGFGYCHHIIDEKLNK